MAWLISAAQDNPMTHPKDINIKLVLIKNAQFSKTFVLLQSSLEVKHFNLNAKDIKDNIFITKNERACACFTGKSSAEVQTHVHSGSAVVHRGRRGE